LPGHAPAALLEVCVSLPLSTGQVCDLLGIPSYDVAYAIRARKLSLPAKDGTGSYAWSEKDIANLKAVLAAKRPQAARRAARGRKA
jgi:hypothetical protein